MLERCTDKQRAILSDALADIMLELNMSYPDGRVARPQLTAVLYRFGNEWTYLITDGIAGSMPNEQ